MGWRACGPGFFWGNGINGGYTWMGLLGMAVQLLFWAALILLGVYLFRLLVRPGVLSNPYERYEASLVILRERYARGEISTDEFKTMKNILS